jgi:formylglycine-generating enzyme required for sulfatase activity
MSFKTQFVLFAVACGVVACERSAVSQDNAADRKTFSNSVGMKVVMIPPGKFLMGSPETEADRDPIEVQHEVEITRPFYLGVHEVTQRQWMAVKMGGRPHFDASRFGGDDNPMENMEWPEAVSFCETLSALPEEKAAGRKYRLPTEAEWEYACRAGSTTAFHYGDSLSSREANFNGGYPYGEGRKGKYLRMTEPVGSRQPNAFGLYDMHGNVAEWCSDFYDKDYYERSPAKDPPGAEQKDALPDDFGNHYHVVRGGCWLDDAAACRSAYRFRAMPTNKYRLIGLRVVCEVKGE